MTFFADYLIDGTGAATRKNAALVIGGGLVNRICDRNEAPPGPDADFSGCTILPCLLDAHVHLFMSGAKDPELRDSQLCAPYSEASKVIERHLEDHLAHGVIAVRDGGDHHGHALRYKMENPDTASPVALRAAGVAIHQPGRYGKLIARPPVNGAALADAVAACPEGQDHVKIVQSGLNSLKEYGKQTQPQFGADAFKAAVRAADRRGMPVMVHANGAGPVGIAVEAGCRSIEHGFFMGEENLGKMAEKGVFWVPTACTMQGYADLLDDPAAADIARRNCDHQRQQIMAARKRGVRVALGTDAGSLGVNHGAAVAMELRLLMDAGFTAVEAVRCAAGTNADLLSLPDLGRLVPGKSASFIVVPGTPDELPENLHRLRAVYVNGVPVRPGGAAIS